MITDSQSSTLSTQPRRSDNLTGLYQAMLAPRTQQPQLEMGISKKETLISQDHMRQLGYLQTAPSFMVYLFELSRCHGYLTAVEIYTSAVATVEFGVALHVDYVM